MRKFFSQNSKILLGLCLTCSIFLILGQKNLAQEVVDKTVAVVSDATSESELITYSDLLWYLALEPKIPIDPPTSDDLKLALQKLIELRLFALEAKRLPSADPTEAEITKQIEKIVAKFNSPAEFRDRLQSVGFDSVKDPNFYRMMYEREKIVKYINFRFRSFVIITQEEEKKYYQDVFTPEFRRQKPGVLVPAFEEVQSQIHEDLEEEKVYADIQRFLDNAKQRAEIVILFEV